MKIAILSSGHGGSTLPLAKAFISQGHIVDYYMIANAAGKETSIEATDLKYIASSIGLQSVSLSNSPQLSKYFRNSLFRFFSITLQRPYRNVPCIRGAMRIIRSYTIKMICNSINNENYDLVNIVGRYNLDEIASYCKYLNSKVIVSLHEVCNHFKPNFEKPSYLLKYLFDNKVDIVVHSSKSYNDMLSYASCIKEKIHLIPFGLFETFSTLACKDNLVLPTKYFLFIGSFTNYKGIDIFIEAADSIKDAKDYRFVIAGSGKCSAIDSINHIERFCVINRFLSNQEFAELLKRATVVVCPYRTASQSGIPQSALVFGKPMIVSDLESFHTVIEDGLEGLYHEPEDVAGLAKQIQNIINDSILLDNLEKNALLFSDKHREYQWNNIADKYLKI